MNPQHANNSRLTKTALIASIVFVPIVLLFGLAAAFSGLDGINPENQGKTAVYPIPEAGVSVVISISLIAIPVAILVAIASIVNLKFKNDTVSWSIIGFCIFALFWILFSSWALSHEYVSSSSTDPSANSTNDSKNDDGSLKIYNYQVN
ncbi:MAG TPA: hypothetical protein PK096_00925 [Candidatus Saccharibacteria bacterium]|nr:hypothetical protein [Candidatus Saccharibacteria bacterium]HRK93916.1 hypothetical protein [Candidatus Saccharibacteria bacterium]